jgi:predicted GNAT superfamily acetyltransferase
MTLRLRDVRDHELDQVLALNNSAGPTILPIDGESARRFSRRRTISGSPRSTVTSPDSWSR